MDAGVVVERSESSISWEQLAFHAANPPVRKTLLGLEQLEDHARRLGALLADAQPEKGFDLPRSFRRTGDELRAAHRAISEAYRNQEALSQDAEWLLDNFHISATHYVN